MDKKLRLVKTSNRQNLKTSKDHADHSDHGDQSSIINLWTENPRTPSSYLYFITFPLLEVESAHSHRLRFRYGR